MNVDEAVEFYAAHARIHHALRLLQDVGLGYLTLGQPSPTLSGGEAQRIKLVTELAKTRGPLGKGGGSRTEPGDFELGNSLGERQSIAAKKVSPGPPLTRGAQHTLYVLDEPTVGLHMADVEKLIRVLHRLVDASNTVVVIEHNLDIIADADWIIDLGPEGGDAGGRIVAEGSPEQVARRKRRSHTAAVLADFLARRSAYATTRI